MRWTTIFALLGALALLTIGVLWHDSDNLPEEMSLIKRNQPATWNLIMHHTQHTTGNWVALTFDDGPHPTFTPQVLAILRQYKIHATFCLVGDEIKANPQFVQQIVADGHRLCDHTMTHDEHISQRSDADIRKEIMGTLQLLQTNAPGAVISYYRSPGGNWNLHLAQLVQSWGMENLGWTIDPRDWSKPGVADVASIVGTVKKNIQPGAIILMHDGGGDRSESVAALKQIIPDLIAKGYQFDFPG